MVEDRDNEVNTQDQKFEHQDQQFEHQHDVGNEEFPLTAVNEEITEEEDDDDLDIDNI